MRLGISAGSDGDNQAEQSGKAQNFNRHCERSEAIQSYVTDIAPRDPGLLRCARNDGFCRVPLVNIFFGDRA
jgi:hypothetical protein